MKVLLDTCVWGGAKAVLEAAGHEVVWVGDWERDPGDEEILAIAHAERRPLVTLDKDFRELAIFSKQPHSGILRLVGIRARDQGPLSLQVLESHATEIAEGALLTAEPGRLRVRPGVRTS